MQYGFVIDQRKCIGCHGCSVACKSENGVALGVHRTWVKYVEKGRFPFTRRFFQVTRCNHCSHPPCVTICPVSAMFQRKDGIVDFDSTRCIGCKACMQACPYDAIYVDPATNTAAKCNYCIHRVDRGLEPACVTMCPQHAIIAGDLEQPDSEIAQLLSREQVRVRKPEQGTAPKTFYVAAEEAAISPTAARYESTICGPTKQTDCRRRGHSRCPQRRDADAGAGGLRRRTPAPWNWQVPVYFWTKSLSTGVLALPAVAIAAGWVQADKLLNLVLVILALVFMGITVGLLDLRLLAPANDFSGAAAAATQLLVERGAYLLVAYTGLCGLYAWRN